VVVDKADGYRTFTSSCGDAFDRPVPNVADREERDRGEHDLVAGILTQQARAAEAIDARRCPLTSDS
jgi:hypothetical protein